MVVDAVVGVVVVVVVVVFAVPVTIGGTPGHDTLRSLSVPVEVKAIKPG